MSDMTYQNVDEKSPTWSIAEQIVQDNATGLRFEFDATSGTMPVLRVFTKERTRVLVLMFLRDRTLVKSDVRGVRDGQLEDVGQAAFQELHQDPAVADAAARASADLIAHTTGGGDPPTEPADPIGDHMRATGKSYPEAVADLAGVDAPAADEAPKQQGVFYGG